MAVQILNFMTMVNGQLGGVILSPSLIPVQPSNDIVKRMEQETLYLIVLYIVIVSLSLNRLWYLLIKWWMCYPAWRLIDATSRPTQNISLWNVPITNHNFCTNRKWNLFPANQLFAWNWLKIVIVTNYIIYNLELLERWRNHVKIFTKGL